MVGREETIVAADLAGAIAKASIDPTREGWALRDALISANADRRRYCDWDVDQASRVVTLMDPEEQDCSGRMLGEGLAWYLVW